MRAFILGFSLMVLVGAVVSVACGGEEGGIELQCDDGLDNDGDGDIDCADADCSSAAHCVVQCNFNAICDATETYQTCPNDCVEPVCGNSTCENEESMVSCPQDCDTPPKVDLLLVVDNSNGMTAAQTTLADQLSSAIDAMSHATIGLPDLHVGVVTTDLGTGSYQITFCDQVGGDNGNLMTGSCALTGSTWFVDTVPQECNIDRDGAGGCTGHDCTQTHCARGTLAADAAGCPRCRNWTGTSLSAAVSCLADQGGNGCGFEQPLEAMRKALDNNAANAGFLRPDSVLAILIVTTEDDCSASTDDLFDNTDTDLNGPLGPLTGYRCHEFGVTCDINDRTTEGPRMGCQPRSDAGAMLYHVSDYVTFLSTLRLSSDVVVATIGGPADSGSVTVALDNGNPAIQQICTTTAGGVTPGIRLRAFVEAMAGSINMSWAYASVCDTDWSMPLSSFGAAVRSAYE